MSHAATNSATPIPPSTAASSYKAAIAQLNSLVPELYASAELPRRKFSVDEVRILLDALGNPHTHFPAVLIAGTNGKGSTASTLASILTEAGQRTGLYTSPHLKRPNERIRIGSPETSSDISDDDFARLYFHVHDAGQELVLSGRLPQLPSYFEILTALAFLHFAENKIDIAVLEVGMGGRLDATNVVDPMLSIVTDISLDHMEWLGPTITDIAREKAGILRRGGTMITLPQHPEANEILGEVAVELDVRGVSAVPYVPAMGACAPYSVEIPQIFGALGATIEVDSPLAGAHQQRNIALAIAAAVELAAHHSFPITPAAIESGIRRTRWPGRLERITDRISEPISNRISKNSVENSVGKNNVEWILDVAHNPAGAWALRAGIRAVLEAHSPRVLIFSCLRDKPLSEMAQILFPLFDEVIVVPLQNARAASVEDLLAAAAATGTPAIAAESVSEALRIAQKRITNHARINQQGPAGGVAVISGSVYLVGEARTLLLGTAES